MLLLQGFEPTTFRSWIWCSNHWAIPAPGDVVWLLWRGQWTAFWVKNNVQNTLVTKSEMLFLICCFQKYLCHRVKCYLPFSKTATKSEMLIFKVFKNTCHKEWNANISVFKNTCHKQWNAESCCFQKYITKTEMLLLQFKKKKKKKSQRVKCSYLLFSNLDDLGQSQKVAWLHTARCRWSSVLQLLEWYLRNANLMTFI